MPLAARGKRPASAGRWSHCLEASALAEHKLEHIRARITRLKGIEKVLREMFGRCHAQQGNVFCPLIESLHEGITKA